MEFTGFDIVIILVVAVSAIMGWMKGLVAQVGSIVALVGAIIACRAFGDSFSAWLSPSLSMNPTLSAILCNILLFIIVYILIMVAARLLRGIVHAVMLGAVDSLGGALFMAFKWLVAMSIVLNVWVMCSPDGSLGNCPPGSPAAIVLDIAPWLMGVAGLK